MNLYFHFQYPSRTKLKSETLYGLHFDSELLIAKDSEGTNIHSLYPYQTTKLSAIVSYKPEYQRNVDIMAIPQSVQLALGLILLFLIISAFVLWILRRKLDRPRNSFVSSFIECLVPFVGGGNVHIRHKLELWFFAILYLSAYFMISVLSGDILDSVVRIQTHKIRTFEQLSEINPPIYLSEDLEIHSEEIRARLQRLMGPNINYKGTKPLKEDANKTKALVLKSADVDLFVTLLAQRNLDSDVLIESLGNTFNIFASFLYSIVKYFRR